MSKKDSFFTPHLQEDEYIIWEGNTASDVNIFHPARYLLLLLDIVLFMWNVIDRVLGFILRPQPILILGLVYALIGWATWNVWGGIGVIFLLVILLPFRIAFAKISANYSSQESHQSRLGKIANQIKNENGIIKSRKTIINPWTPNQYAITNNRVLLLENCIFSESSLILMQDAIKSKPKNNQSDISLYNSRSQTGELPPPIATLNNLSEEDAETAYDLLIHARDISFEERIEDLGLD